jgi:hypothetical protein
MGDLLDETQAVPQAARERRRIKLPRSKEWTSTVLILWLEKARSANNRLL